MSPASKAWLSWNDGRFRYTGPREDVDLDRYPPFRPPLLGPIEISRGCPWNCAYCQTPALFGHRMRHRSVDAICKYDKFYEDKRLVSPNAFAYGSDGIKPDPGAVERLLKNLSGDIYFGTFPSEVRPEFVTPEMVGLVNDLLCEQRDPSRRTVGQRPCAEINPPRPYGGAGGRCLGHHQ